MTKPKPQRYFVLLMTATSVEVEDLNETLAVETAIGAVKLKDPHEFTWVARAVSDRPFDIADADAEEPLIEPEAPSKIIS